MIKSLSILLILAGLLSCELKNREISNIQADSLLKPNTEVNKPIEDVSLDTKIFLLDSTLEVNDHRFKDYKGNYQLGGVNIIDHVTKKWLFDSEGPQIESYSDLKKVNDEYFVVSVYYDLITSEDTIPQKLQVAQYELKIDNNNKSYTFKKDSLFWPSPAPFTSSDVSLTIEEYERIMNEQFISDSTNNDLPNIMKMFRVQQRLLSSFVSGCDSCKLYSSNLFQKYDHALFASHSDYAGEIASVFVILDKHN